jgi:hypothetical protein
MPQCTTKTPWTIILETGGIFCYKISKPKTIEDVKLIFNVTPLLQLAASTVDRNRGSSNKVQVSITFRDAVKELRVVHSRTIKR